MTLVSLRSSFNNTNIFFLIICAFCWQRYLMNKGWAKKKKKKQQQEKKARLSSYSTVEICLMDHKLCLIISVLQLRGKKVQQCKRSTILEGNRSLLSCGQNNICRFGKSLWFYINTIWKFSWMHNEVFYKSSFGVSQSFRKF